MNDLKALMQRFVDEVQTQHRLDVIDELIADDFVNHSATAGLRADREGVKMQFAAFFQGFPDLRAEIHDMLVENDKVVTRKTFHGTHQGEFMGVPATGKAIAVNVIDIVRVRDGRFVEHWNVIDQLAMLQQLALVTA